MSALLGVIADDLTGGADAAGVLAKAGARARLLVGVPEGPPGPLPAPGADALVVALKSRSAPVAEAVRDSLAALAALRAAGAGQVLQKVCSTFDSTREGNIGPVALALLEALGATGAAVCPAYPANGRTVYMGHLFVGDRLLSESGMERHPLTPMTDPDLRRWLAAQADEAVGHVALAELRAGRAREALAAGRARGERLMVCDAVEDGDLLALGRAVAGDALAVGGSAIAAGLLAGTGTPMARPEAPPAARPVAGPGLALAGSCSRATLEQVERHAQAHPVHRLDPAAVLADPEGALAAALAFARAHRDRRPLVASTAPPEAVAAAQARWGREALALRLDAFFARLARAARSDGVRAVVVAGGETAGAVAGALGPRAWEVGGEVAPGVPTLYAAEGAGGEGPEPGVALGAVLKSGNFGSPAFFDDAFDALEAGR